MLDTTGIEELLAQGETLSVEFKSDRKALPDRDLVTAVVALANTEGGVLLLGVEDTGEVTGLHDNHRDLTGLAALIANRTNPSLAVRVSAVQVSDMEIAQFDLTPSTQKSEQETRRALEKLTEAGLVEVHGSGRGRTYTLSAHVYRKAGQKAGYIHQAGFDPIQQEQMVLRFIDEHGSIKRADVMELCRLSAPQAYHLLKRLEKAEG